MQVRVTGRLSTERYPHRDRVVIDADSVVWAGPEHEDLVAGVPSVELEPDPTEAEAAT